MLIGGLGPCVALLVVRPWATPLPLWNEEPRMRGQIALSGSEFSSPFDAAPAHAVTIGAATATQRCPQRRYTFLAEEAERRCDAAVLNPRPQPYGGTPVARASRSGIWVMLTVAGVCGARD